MGAGPFKSDKALLCCSQGTVCDDGDDSGIVNIKPEESRAPQLYHRLITIPYYERQNLIHKENRALRGPRQRKASKI
jgi:hypothetical protein